MTMPAKKLKPSPCPFCGGEPEVKQRGTHWLVICDECACSTTRGCSETMAEAIAGWNRRYNDAEED